MAKGDRVSLDFEMIGIPVGAELSFFRDENVRCLVVRQYSPRVLFRGRELTVNAATREAYALGHPSGKQPDFDVAGSQCWKYEGRTLWERRLWLERYHCQRDPDYRDEKED